MTEKKKASPDKRLPESVLFGLKLLIVIALAFCAGLVFRRSVGIVSMFPIAFLLCGAAAFISIKPRFKMIIFPVTVFMLNTVEIGDKKIALTFATLCLLANCVAEYSAIAFRKKQKRFFAVAPLGFVVCVVLSFCLIGNPFAAIKANGELKKYTNENYPKTEDAALGEFSFSPIYYNAENKTYAISATSSDFPTEFAEISYKNGMVRDSFSRLLETKIKEPYEIEFTAFLRDIFPTDSFNVECISVAATPDCNIFTSKDGELKENVSYEITLGGIQTGSDMMKRVKYYMSLLDRADAQYDELFFKSGTGPFVRRCIKIDRNRQKFDFDLELSYVPTGIPESFSDFDFQPPERQ